MTLKRLKMTHKTKSELRRTSTSSPSYSSDVQTFYWMHHRLWFTVAFIHNGNIYHSSIILNLLHKLYSMFFIFYVLVSTYSFTASPNSVIPSFKPSPEIALEPYTNVCFRPQRKWIDSWKLEMTSPRSSNEVGNIEFWKHWKLWGFFNFKIRLQANPGWIDIVSLVLIRWNSRNLATSEG